MLPLNVLSIGIRHFSVGVCAWHLRGSQCTRSLPTSILDHHICHYFTVYITFFNGRFISYIEITIFTHETKRKRRENWP
jgi:hypothetical protein